MQKTVAMKKKVVVIHGKSHTFYVSDTAEALKSTYITPEDLTPELIAKMATGGPVINDKGELVLLGPGIFPDIPNAYYHGQLKDYISSSFMKKFMQYPACALQPTEVTETMNIGSAIHAYSLEGRDAFNKEFALTPVDAPKKATKTQREAKNPSADAVASMKWWAEFEEKCEGRTILPAIYDGLPMAQVIKGADGELNKHPTVKLLLKKGMREVTIIWIDPDSGLICKARADVYPEEQTCALADLKKTREATRAAFIRQICNLNYDIQGGHYTNGVEANGRPVNKFIFIGVQDTFPFSVKTVYLGGGEEGNAWLRKAQHEARRILLQIAECYELGHFPTYELPLHTVPISQITALDLLEEAVCPPWRFGYGEAPE